MWENEVLMMTSRQEEPESVTSTPPFWFSTATLPSTPSSVTPEKEVVTLVSPPMDDRSAVSRA